MRFIFICLMALIWGNQTLWSQTYNIEYYQLKKVRKNNVTSSISGNYGIFTTRVKQICYDSHSDGSMNYKSDLKYEKQSNGIYYYTGKCYLDNYCSYIFNDSKGILNVALSNGDVYVYYKASPPYGCKDGTYYNPRSGNSSYDNGGPAYVAPPVNSSGSGTTSPSKSYKKTAHPRKCAKCVGRGICGMCHGKGTYYVFGQKTIICPRCNGTGKCQVCYGSGTHGSEWY